MFTIYYIHVSMFTIYYIHVINQGTIYIQNKSEKEKSLK